jgi:hypothetical protein
MNTLSKSRKQLAVAIAFLAVANFAATAQTKPVESTHTDEKYANTTVVYKATAASDSDVLSALEGDFGIGDVVRVTVAPPPKPVEKATEKTAAPAADKSKGEDTWLPAATKANPAAALTASTGSVVNKPAAKPAPVAIAQPASAKPAAAVTTKTAALAAPKQVKAIAAPVAAPQVKTEAPTIATDSKTTVKVKTAAAGKSAKSYKSIKKTGKKSSGAKPKPKSRKSGKQRYGCYKF